MAQPNGSRRTGSALSGTWKQQGLLPTWADARITKRSLGLKEHIDAQDVSYEGL